MISFYFISTDNFLLCPPRGVIDNIDPYEGSTDIIRGSPYSPPVTVILD